MSTVILLSSSPPRVFARSPTPADSSSPLPSTAALIQDHSPGRKKFKNIAGQRDGFSIAFKTARQVLGDNKGARNATIGSSARNKFRSSQTEEVKGSGTTRSGSAPESLPRTDATKALARSHSAQQIDESKNKTLVSKLALEGDEEGKAKVSSEPLFVEKAVARKTDWTPSKSKSQRQDDEKSTAYSAGFVNGLLHEFTFAPDSKEESGSASVVAPNPAKRRRVEPAKKVNVSAGVNSVPLLASSASAPMKKVTKRLHSPAKKALTITGLATSNYVGAPEPEESPMMQYLTSTQAQLDDMPETAVLETQVRKTKATLSKLRKSKKAQPKSLLLSPESALKALEEQDAIFGSASQLAREESPKFLREIIQAMNESEMFVMSDPFSSPQRTQPTSNNNTPNTGTSRFRRSRNLWAAAGRDDDNALLHVDTVDLSDTPAVRSAFAGKDVLLQAGSTSRALNEESGMFLRGGYSPLARERRHSVIDIGDIPTPNINQTRAFSSTRVDTSPQRSPSRATHDSAKVAQSDGVAKSKAKKAPPPKPDYAGFTIPQMNKIIKSYGFKAMRKREKMIELLDMCWNEKHGITESTESTQPAEPETVPFDSLLSKVHDLSTRPEPKLKKVKVCKKKDDKEAEPKEKPARKPRQSKKKAPEAQDEAGAITKPKQTRKRKPKLAVVDSLVQDVDSICDTPEETKALEVVDLAKPECVLKPNMKIHPDAAIARQTQEPSTPGANLPTQSIQNSTTSSEAVPAVSENGLLSTDRGPTPAPKTELSLTSSQITAAVTHQSKVSQPGRNHNANPTWHEKILLYDPIVLEDLAAWLNTEGLGAIGDDREISALEVREWCESKGICCLWRGGWRGNKATQAEEH